MFTAFYITVALLQFSLGQESIQNESEILQDVDTTQTPNENLDGDFIMEPMSVKGSNDDNVPVNNENNKDYIGEPIEPVLIFAEPVEQGRTTTTTSYETEETTFATGLINEVREPEVDDVVKVIPKNTVTVSGPVTAGGKVTIIARFGCEDENNGFTLSEEVPETSGPIRFNGCANSQGKVTIAAHFGCGESTGNVVTLPEIDKASNDISDESVSFEGPVHAQGKVVMGSHYGCAPFGMPPPALFPWFPPFFNPQFYYPPYPIPGYTTQYPNTYPGFKFQDMANEPGNQNFSKLPVASNLGNSVTGNMDTGIPFGGVVPASGTVSIAARF